MTRARAAAATAAALLALALTAPGCSTPGAATNNPRTTERSSMSATVYDAFRLTADDRREPIGRISITRGVLAIVSLANESDRAAVQASLDEFNNREFLVEKAPPPPGTEGRYGLGATEYERGRPGFDEVLIRKLESGRRIRLEPAK